jgi:hypothetical protein
MRTTSGDSWSIRVEFAGERFEVGRPLSADVSIDAVAVLLTDATKHVVTLLREEEARRRLAREMGDGT